MATIRHLMAFGGALGSLGYCISIAVVWLDIEALQILESLRNFDLHCLVFETCYLRQPRRSFWEICRSFLPKPDVDVLNSVFGLSFTRSRTHNLETGITAVSYLFLDDTEGHLARFFGVTILIQGLVFIHSVHISRRLRGRGSSCPIVELSQLCSKLDTGFS